jgi:collagenase-like PrtC family protease
MLTGKPFELVCPAGALPALKAAIDNGADCVYTGLKDNTNARNFTGLNFDDAQLREGIRYAHDRGARCCWRSTPIRRPPTGQRWTAAVDKAADFGVDAIILADPGLMAYARKTHPQLRLHLSVQGSATSYEAINFYHEQFGIQRAVLPRVLSWPQIEQPWCQNTPVEIEVFGFGGLCVMVEGRCALSAYATGESPNTTAPARPASTCAGSRHPSAAWRRASTACSSTASPRARRPAIRPCARAASRSTTRPTTPSRNPTSLNTLELLPKLMASASRPSRSRAASAARPTSPRSPRCGAQAIDSRPAQPPELLACARPGWRN